MAAIDPLDDDPLHIFPTDDVFMQVMGTHIQVIGEIYSAIVEMRRLILSGQGHYDSLDSMLNCLQVLCENLPIALEQQALPSLKRQIEALKAKR